MPSTDKRFPVVFLLDFSGSMLGPSRYQNPKIDMMNKFVEDFMRMCMDHSKARRCTDLSFVLFTDKIVAITEFRDIRDLGPGVRFEYLEEEYFNEINWKEVRVDRGERISIPRFWVSKKDNGTDIGNAVRCGIKMIEDRIGAHGGQDQYSPMLILVTDGHPVAENQYISNRELANERAAINKLREHEYTTSDACNLIIPLVVPVEENRMMGSGSVARLKRYVEHFDAGYLTCDSDREYKNLAFINSILSKSLDGSTALRNLAQLVQDEPHNSGM